MQDGSQLGAYLWFALALLVLGSVYLIVEGYKVHKLFAESVVGKLIKALVVVFLIELYSLGIVSFAFFFFYPRGAVVLLPILALWIVSLIFAILAVRTAKNQVSNL
ncbi:MAG: hypothetical protein P4L74_01665 [Candidatus Doudnabacteria bacterium]|nr:hypothetical protein [Candidatus Doudnabacteria bacterium]